MSPLAASTPFTRAPSLTRQPSVPTSHLFGFPLLSRQRSSAELVFEKSSSQDKLAALLRDNFRFFAQVPYRRLSMLCANFRMINVPKHEALCFEGSPCEGVFVMLVGMAKLYTTASSQPGAASNPHSTQPTKSASDSESGENSNGQSFKLSKSGSLSIHHAVRGLDPASEIDMLGAYRELYCGDVAFEEEAAHGLKYSSSIFASENMCDFIFIDLSTYQDLATPCASQTPDPWISVGISLEDTPFDERSAEDEARIAGSIKFAPGFADLDPHLLQDIARHVKIRRLPTESLILQSGEKSDTVFVLLQGTVSVHEPPRGERRRIFGNAGLTSALGMCTRIGYPGEEPFGLNSVINSCEDLCTVACRSSCLFYTLSRTDLQVVLFSRFYSACRKIIRRPAYMKQPREDRKDHQILNIVNYLKENPFFSNLDFSALSRLALSTEIVELSKGGEVAGELEHRSSQQLAIVNKGSVSTTSARKNTKQIKMIRFQPFGHGQSRATTANGAKSARGDGIEGAAQEGSFTRAPSSSSQMQPANAFSRRPSEVSASVAAGRLIMRAPSFSRLPSGSVARSSKWNVAFAVSAMKDSIERAASSNDDLELIDHLVAAYGQGFWTGMFYCFANQDDTELFIVNKSEYRKILTSHSTSDVSEVSSLLNSHPCFQGLKSSEIQNFLQYAKHVRLNEGTVLFHSGSILSDVFFLKEGSIELRTNDIYLDRDPMSAGAKHHIPSSIVASVVDTDAIINDIINLTEDTPVEVLQRWMEHNESYTAVASSAKTTIVAISKVALVTLLSVERRTQMLLTKQRLDSFHVTRCRVLENTHEGLLHQRQIIPWKHPVPKKVREQNEIISGLQNKKFAHKQPPIHRPPWTKHVTDSLDQPRYVAALVSPRFKGVQLPRMHSHSKPDVEPMLSSHVASNSPSAHKRSSPRTASIPPSQSPSAAGKSHSSTFGFQEV